MCYRSAVVSTSLELATRLGDDAASISKENDIVARRRLGQFFYASFGRSEAAGSSEG
jgi:hypothetical protein